jgi:hypothetical protein
MFEDKIVKNKKIDKKDAKNELSQQWLTRQTRNPSHEIWITS